MKKYILAIPLFAMLLTACDPTTESEGSVSENMTTEKLEQAVTLTQLVANQNKFTYSTEPVTTVQILDPDGNILITGSNGAFDILPGGAELQNLTVRAMNQNGALIAIQKSYTVTEFIDVHPAWEFLCGDGSKEWTYDEEVLGGGWGNLGYKADPNFAETGAGKWWGCPPADLPGQLGGLGVSATGEETPDAFMTFKLSGKKIIKNTGSAVIGEGTFSFDMTATEGWEIGKFFTSEGAILFPYKINGGGFKPTTFDIMRLDDEKFILTYADAGTGQWGEATFWAFTAK